MGNEHTCDGQLHEEHVCETNKNNGFLHVYKIMCYYEANLLHLKEAQWRELREKLITHNFLSYDLININ